MVLAVLNVADPSLTADESEHVLMAHLQPGSLAVDERQVAQAGDPVDDVSAGARLRTVAGCDIVVGCRSIVRRHRKGRSCHRSVP